MELRNVDQGLFGPWEGETRPQRHGHEVVDRQVFHQHAETQGSPGVKQDIGPGADQWCVRHGDIIDPGKPQALQVRVDVLVEDDFTSELLLEPQVAEHLDETALPGPGRHGLLVSPVPTFGHHLCRSCTALVGELQAHKLRARETAAVIAGRARDAAGNDGVLVTRAHPRSRARPGCAWPGGASSQGSAALRSGSPGASIHSASGGWSATSSPSSTFASVPSRRRSLANDAPRLGGTHRRDAEDTEGAEDRPDFAADERR